MRLSLLLFLFLTLSVGQAWGADTVLCGDDDDNGVVDLIKTAGLVDRDCDGEASVADGGYDCDDTNALIDEGAYTTSGCAGGEQRQCVSGSYTSCTTAAIAPRTNNWYVSPSGSGTTCSSGSPCLLSTVSTSGGKTIADDTAIIITGSGTFAVTEKFVTTVAGTSSALRNIILKDPRSTAVIATTSSCSGICTPVKASANNWIYQGLEITGGDTTGSGGIRMDGDNQEALFNYIHDVQGDNNANLSGIYIKDGGSNIDVHDNIVNNTQDPSRTLAGDTRQNVFNINAFEGEDIIIDNNRVGYDHAVNTVPYYNQGGGIRFKHGSNPASVTLKSYARNNIIYNTEYSGIQNEGDKRWFSGNLIVGAAHCISETNASNGAFHYFTDRKDSNNTCVAGVHTTANSNGQGAVNILTGTDTITGTSAGGLTISGNVFVDSAQTTYGGGNFLSMYHIQPYGPDVNYTSLLITTRALESNNNCFYNSAITSLTSGFVAFADNSSTSNGSTVDFANWQASPYTQDAASTNANPTLDADYRVTTNCTTGSGWEDEWPTSAPTPTPTPTPTGGGFVAAIY